MIDLFASKHVLHRLNDQIFPHVHRQRERLQDEMIAVAIDDHARQSVALAPDEAAKSRIDSAPRRDIPPPARSGVGKNRDRDPVSGAKNAAPRFAICCCKSRCRSGGLFRP